MHKKCKQIERGERRLVALIDQLGTFTEQELTAKLFKSRPPILLTPFWSVKRYLEEFRELGSLGYSDGRYTTGRVSSCIAK